MTPAAPRHDPPQQSLAGWWRRRPVALEIAANLAFIISIPIALRVFAPITNPLFFVLGFNDILGLLTGGNGLTDIGWEVAASKALITPGVSAYAGIDQIGALIGMPFADSQAISHPPTSLPLWIWLTALPYSWLPGLWIPAMVSTLAITLRVMRVPASAAYPVALGIAATRYGQVTLSTTYPLMGLVLALAWRNRSRVVPAGLAYGILAASRTIGGILLVYPLIRRQWRVVLIAGGFVVAMLGLAMVLEPDVLDGFRTGGQASINFNMSRPLTTPSALVAYIGLPGISASIVSIAVAGWVVLRGQSIFWVLGWLSLALSPIAWPHSFPLGLPLAVVIWESGRFGRVLVSLSAVPLVASTSGVVVVWPIFIALMGVGLIACPITDIDQRSLNLRPSRFNPWHAQGGRGVADPGYDSVSSQVSSNP